MNLSCCLKYVVDSLGLGTLFRLKVHLVLGEAEFTIPYLANIFNFFGLRVLVEDGLASLTEDWVTGGQLRSIGKTLHVD